MPETLTSRFEAIPFAPIPGREAVVSRIVREMARFETIFTDYERACVPLCENVLGCERCTRRLQNVSRILSDARAMCWEVWRTGEDADVVGVLYLSDVIPGSDARAHYTFFDEDLQGKTQLLEEMIEWCFADHDDWIGLRRLTIEVPVFAFALAKHAAKRLKFGGGFEYANPKNKRLRVKVEGVKEGMIPWRGSDCDVLILGRLRGQLQS